MRNKQKKCLIARPDTMLPQCYALQCLIRVSYGLRSKLKSIINVKEQSPGHFYWPEIDVDLTEEIIENFERFPLKAKNL